MEDVAIQGILKHQVTDTTSQYVSTMSESGHAIASHLIRGRAGFILYSDMEEKDVGHGNKQLPTSSNHEAGSGRKRRQALLCTPTTYRLHLAQQILLS